MARTCINIPVGLARDGRVLSIGEKLGVHVGTVFHCLLTLWMAAADQDLGDGIVRDLSVQDVDSVGDVSGLGDALMAAGLITEVEGGIVIAEYVEANGPCNGVDAQWK